MRTFALQVAATEEQQRTAQTNPQDVCADQADEESGNSVDQSAMEPQPDAKDNTEDAASQNEVTADAVEAANTPVDATSADHAWTTRVVSCSEGRQLWR